MPNSSERRARKRSRDALKYMMDAWSEAIDEGHDPDMLANAALFTAFTDLVAAYGEDEIMRFARTLPERIGRGEFTTVRRLQ